MTNSYRMEPEWETSGIFVPKKDMRLPFCADCIKFSTMTVKGMYLSTLLDECIDSHGLAVLYHPECVLKELADGHSQKGRTENGILLPSRNTTTHQKAMRID